MKAVELNKGNTESFKKIGILTTCMDDWGGSEELWARSLPILQQWNYQFVVLKSNINPNHPEYVALAQRGVEFRDLEFTKQVKAPLYVRGWRRMERIGYKWSIPFFKDRPYEEPVVVHLKKSKPDLVIISQGVNFDALIYAHKCMLLKIPYVIVSQKAAEFYWPENGDRAYMIETFKNAKKNFFVSHHNYRLTEEQFGLRLPNSKVVFNPVKVSGKALPYPSASGGFKLACVARLFLIDKGQDILLRVLSQQKWRERPLTISFIGEGIDAEGLMAMTKLLDIRNVEFKGHVNDIENLWNDYHALILPSRSEGLPLAMLEAMAAGRPVIVTKVGGNAEIVEEGITGFLCQPNEDSLDEAMERAWNDRDRWEAMGKVASTHIALKIPVAPENTFAHYINEIINE